MNTPDESRVVQAETHGPAAALPEALHTTGAAATGTAAGDGPEQIADLLGPVKAWLTVPFRTRHGSAVLLAGAVTRDGFTQADLEIAAALAEQGAAAYDNAQLFNQVKQLATTDSLTGIANRRHFTELADRQMTIAQRNHRPLWAMMLDIDHFKRVNDSYGHATGDVVIKSVAKAVGASIRSHDIVGRLGGEEFAVILPEAHGDPVEVAERIRTAIEITACPGADGPVHVTVSLGLAELKPDDTLDSLLRRADEALYHAKQNGRNQVRVG